MNNKILQSLIYTMVINLSAKRGGIWGSCNFFTMSKIMLLKDESIIFLPFRRRFRSYFIIFCKENIVVDLPDQSHCSARIKSISLFLFYENNMPKLSGRTTRYSKSSIGTTATKARRKYSNHIRITNLHSS